MTLYIAPVVEGHAEQKCVVRLLQRVWYDLLGRNERLQVLPPDRGKRDQLIHAVNSTLPATVQRAYQSLRSKIHGDPDGKALVRPQG